MATQIQAAITPPIAVSRLPSICFKLASFTALVGVSLGIYMGIGGDHTLAPVHVHLNLIGWVSLFVFGLFYKFHPQAVSGAAIAQITMVVVGYIVMLSGLAGLLLTANSDFMPFAVVGSLLVWASFLLFSIIVARTA
jgi:hypothetical protein